jgi:SAM-dependent methyltransferase
VGTRQDWNDLASVDPLWAVLSTRRKEDGGWDLDEFFATGEGDVAHLLVVAEALGRPARRDRALDFGCGVGRLTRALARRFSDCVGVDLSERMIEKARSLNASVPNCTFVAGDEPPGDPFDLVVANLVLQHLPSKVLARVYIDRLIRAARPDGLVVFQLPTELPITRRLQPRRRLYAALRTLGASPKRLHAAGLHPIRMLALPEAEVRETVERSGGTLAHTEPAGGAGLRYYVHHRSA